MDDRNARQRTIKCNWGLVENTKIDVWCNLRGYDKELASIKDSKWVAPIVDQMMDNR